MKSCFNIYRAQTRLTLGTSILLGLAIGSSQPAHAYEPDDWIIRAGAATVAPNASSSPIVIETLGLGASTTEVNVDSDTQLGLTATYMLNSQFGIELLAASPFKHSIEARGGAKLAETYHLPPTLTLNYYFNAPQSDFQPYIGAGVNYTVFFDEDTTRNLNDATFSALVEQATAGALVNAISNAHDTTISLDDSWGLALHAGFDYRLNAQWGIHIAYWHINIDTHAEISTRADVATVGTDVPISAFVDVDIDPAVYMAGLSYTF